MGLGAGMEAIELQPSGACGRLPAAGACRTVPRHAGSLRGARVARLRAPRYGAPPAPPRGAAAHGVLRVRSHRTQLAARQPDAADRSEEHTSELQSPVHLVCRLLLEKKKKIPLLPFVTERGITGKNTI